jgi:integrase
MRSKTALLARVKVGKSYPFVPVDIRRNNPVAVDGATYYLRYSQDGRQVTQPVGANVETAFAAYQNRELQFARKHLGLPENQTLESSRVLISDAVQKFIVDLEVDVERGKKSRATLRSYKNAVEAFRADCANSGVRHLHEITADVLKRHETWLFKTMARRKRGDQINTIANRFRFLSVFLARNGIKIAKAKNAAPDDKGLLDWSDMPREKEKEFINKYSEDELNALLAVSDEDEADLLHTFLRTGCRDEEIVYLHWSDINFKRREIKISAKPQYGWKVKDRESRIIPVEDGVLLERLSERKQRQSPENQLVFPNTLGAPDQHLIRRLRKVANRAVEKGFAFEGEVNLHRFRRTYASMMIADSDLQTVSELLGHEDIETTVGYLAPDRSKARKASGTAFKAIK